MPRGTHLVCRNLPPDISPFQISVPSRQSLVVLMMARCSSAKTIRKHGKIYYLLFIRPRNTTQLGTHRLWQRKRESTWATSSCFIWVKDWGPGFPGSLFIADFKTQEQELKAQGRKKTSVPYPRLSTSTQMLKQRSLGSQKLTVKAYTAGTSQKWWVKFVVNKEEAKKRTSFQK